MVEKEGLSIRNGNVKMFKPPPLLKAISTLHGRGARQSLQYVVENV